MNAAHPVNAAHLATLHTMLADVRAWSPSKRRDALIADYEAQIEEYTDIVECGAEMMQAVEECATVEVETSAVLDRAMTAARTTGCTLVKGASLVGREMERLVPGCRVQRGVWTVATDDGEYRLVVRDGAFTGVMHWRKA